MNLPAFREVTPAIERGPEETNARTWITSLGITPENALGIARANRRCRGVEDETFDALEKQGYRLASHRAGRTSRTSS